MGLYLLNIALFFYIENCFPIEDEIHMIGKIIGIKEEKEYYDKYILKIMKNTRYPKTEKQNVIIYVEKGNEYFPGDIVNINGMFNKSENARNYGGFNYNRYLLQNRIFGTIKCEYIEKIGEENSINLKILLLRAKLCKGVDNVFNENCSQFLKGLLFGKIDGISDDIKENFEISNISHILAISGMHVVYVLIGMKFITNIIIKNKKIENMILIIFLFFFYILSGAAVSCLRACIMSTMTLVASIIYKKNNFFISFLFSLIIILLINPYNLYNIGMWLSYLGTFGIVVFYKFLKRISSYYIEKIIIKIKENKKTVKDGLQKKYFYTIIENKIFSYIFDNFLLSISAQILIFPIMIYAFNTISFTFFISNILVSAFIAPALILGYLTVFLSYIPIPFYQCCLLIEEVIISIILKIGEVCSKIPLSRVYVSTPNLILVIIYYVFILLIIQYFYKRNYYCLKVVMSFNFLKKQIKICLKYIFTNLNKCIIKISESDINKMSNTNKFINIKVFSFYIKVFLIITTFLIIVCIIITLFEMSLKIYFIDVGQGDCTVIQTPNNRNIIIDGGEGNSEKYDYGENVVLPYLLDRGISQIDYLIISHCDSDHIGGLFAVLENLKVEQVLIGIQPELSEQFKDLIKIANKKKIEIKFLKAGDILNLEENIKLDVLWPVEGELIEENALNNNSLVFKLCYKEFSVLFTGDVEKDAEEEIVKKYDNQSLNASILKVAHHGSKTSSTKEFLKKVSPKIALIGVGKNNKFGHPSEDILKLLNEFNIKIYRTDINGEIEIKIKKNVVVTTMLNSK